MGKGPADMLNYIVKCMLMWLLRGMHSTVSAIHMRGRSNQQNFELLLRFTLTEDKWPSKITPIFSQLEM